MKSSAAVPLKPTQIHGIKEPKRFKVSDWQQHSIDGNPKNFSCIMFLSEEKFLIKTPTGSAFFVSKLETFVAAFFCFFCENFVSGSDVNSSL